MRGYTNVQSSKYGNHANDHFEIREFLEEILDDPGKWFAGAYIKDAGIPK